MEILKNFLPDYRLNLIDINKIEDTSVFRSCLHHIFNMVRLRKDKRGLYQYLEEHREELDRFDSVERMAALVLLGEQKRVAERLNKNDQEGKDETVCEAITEMLMDSKMEGRQEGKMEGENRMAKLNQALLADKRLADLERASADSDYRLQMFEEYGI